MSPTIAPLILSQQIGLLYRNVRMGQLISVINASLLAWVASGVLGMQALLVWWLLAVVTAGIRTALAARYQATPAAERLRDVAFWQQRAIFGAAASGLVWAGGALLLMSSDDLATELFTAFTMAGMVAGAVPVLAAQNLAFRCYAWPIILAVAFGSLGSAPIHIAFTVMSMLFLVVASRSANHFHNILLDTLRLEFEQEQLIRRLEDAHQETERSNRAKTEFLANISHELRTPMNGIFGMAELLSYEELSSGQREMLGMLRGSADELLRSMNNLIELSELEAGRITIKQAPFVLTEVMANLLAQGQAKLGTKALTLNLQIAPDMPEVLVGDAEHLSRALSHLIDNAIKFTTQGQVEITVNVLASNNDEIEVDFSVSDTGIGIAAKQIPELMTGLLVQADGSSIRRHGGIGVGLPLARGLIRCLGGQLHIDSQLGEGSRFGFSLSFLRITEHGD